jgi:MarR family transcriptional regulator, temperature-dependent positive regulator of motility
MSKPSEEAAPISAVVDPQAPLLIPNFDLNLSPSHLLHRAQQVAADFHNAAFGASGLTQRQLAVLIVLGTGDGISQTVLVAKTGIDRSTLAEMVARMEAKGLMLRVKSVADSRANAVHLTPLGREALVAALPRLAVIDESVLALVSANYRDSLIKQLKRILLTATERAVVDKKPRKKDKKKKDKKKKMTKAQS